MKHKIDLKTWNRKGHYIAPFFSQNLNNTQNG